MTTDSFSTVGGDIVVKRGGIERFNTAKPQFRRVPQATITLGTPTAYGITFPTCLANGFNYHYATFAGMHGTAEQCVSAGKLTVQEWGPAAMTSPLTGLNYAAPYLLPDIDLGAVPSGCDLLDVRVNLTRTQAPSLTGAAHPIYGLIDWPIEFVEGDWTPLPDDELIVERIVGFDRMFWFEIVAGRVLLRRRQSVAAAGFETHLIDARQNDPGTASLGPVNAGGSGCSITNPFNSQSVYSGQIVIIPGISV